MDGFREHAVLLLHVAMGIGLAACAGLRAFLPPLVVGLAARYELVELSGTFGWLAEPPALIVFGVAVVAEVLADKIPLVDHLLDSVETLVKPVAGGFVAATVVDHWAPLYVTVAAIVGGGSTAALVHVTKAKLRLVSTATTAGMGNPLLSASEDGVALAGAIASIVVPGLVVLLFVIGAVGAWWAIRRLRPRRA